MRPASSFDVVVVGASAGGLAAAWYASRRGLSVAVVDRDVVVGGLAASKVVDGQRVDLGSHALQPTIRPDLLADLKGLLGDELQWRQTGGRIRLDGRWFGFPFRSIDLLRNAPMRLAAAAARDVVLGPIRTRRARRGGVEPASFGARVRAELGPALAQVLYEPYARKLWDADPDELSPDLFRRRLGPRQAPRVLRTVLRRGSQTGFWYPAGGFGRIPEAMAADLEARGGNVLLSTEAVAVEPSYHGVTVALGDGGELRARTLVTTTSPRALLEMFSGSPLIVREAVQHMRHRAAVFVYLSVPMHRYTDFQAHHFPEPSLAVIRVSEPKAYRASSADPVGRTVLCAEVPASLGDETWMLDDDALAERVRVDLLSVGLPDPKPTTVHVERRAGVYPVYELGYERRQRVVEAWINGLPNVLAVPRQTFFALDNTHQALATGEALAGCLRHDGSVDGRRWREAQATFRAHLVEG